jgi:hypothetical protein
MRIKVMLLALAAASCNGAPTEVRVDQAFDLKVGQSARLEELDATIRFISVSEDSRCPKTVVCVWAGNGRVRLEVVRTDRTDTLELNTGIEPRTGQNGPLLLRLDALSPWPEDTHGIPAQDYRATLVAVRAGPPPL